MEKLRNSGSLKIICYILIPILVAIMGLSIFHLAFLNEYGNEGEKDYTETEEFANNYIYFILNKISSCEEQDIEKSDFIRIEDSNGKEYYYSNSRTSYYKGLGSYIEYIFIDKETKMMYTNIKSNNYQEEMNNMKNNKIYWNYIDNNIDTNIEYINQNNIKYNYNYNYSNNSESGLNIEVSNYEYDNNGNVYKKNKKTLNDYEVYTKYNENRINQITDFALVNQIYKFMLQNRELPIYALIISLILLILIAIYLFWAIGHKKGEKEISLNAIDNIPYEILSIICLTVASIFLSILMNVINIVNYVIFVVCIIIYFIFYAICAVMGVTTIKRIKAKKFWKSFLTYKVIKWFTNKIKKFTDELKNNTKSTKKIFWYYWGFVLLSIILASAFQTGLSIILLIVFWIWAYYKIRKYIRQQDQIKKALEKIYKGETEVFLDEKELEGVLKEMAIYINDIAGGFSNAIEQSLKSERLKTELITNVSHDIKTPLTSIINYVDLLKKENIQGEKVKEYIEILDKKSQRLKKLTEDLVEASKVSSGNVKLNIEQINLKELINQTIGEFKDRFEEKNLVIEANITNDEIKINADNRYMYRIIENLFSNITKYALDSSRVYIDMKQEKNNINISIKNISKEKLNISSDELMQRFVRGDKSRYTEGSGLGLSIAKSLTELQEGTFDIIIDGDLFKVVMIWKLV